MKKIILIITLVTFSLVGFAQGNTKTISGYGGPLVQVARINSDWGNLIGGKGGAVINNKFAVGGIGMIMVNNNEFMGLGLNGDNNVPLTLEYGSGGVFVECLVNADGPIRFSFPLNLMGGIAAINKNSSDEELESSGVFIIEPGIDLSLRISDNFRPTINVSYKQAIGLSLDHLSNQDLSGLSLGLVFKFGNY